MNNIKIFISYHKKCRTLKSDILTPIQVGAKMCETDLGMLRDDIGDNISGFNARLCETTAQYWAWKNCQADYYGFMQYRRHLVFNDITDKPDLGGLLYFDNITDEYINYIGLNDEVMLKRIKEADIFLTPCVDTSSWGACNNEVQFSSLANLHAKDFNIVCKIIEDKYPDYVEDMKNFRLGHEAYWYNMFVMKKEYFNDYCTWLFDILLAADRLIDYTNYSIQETRTLAFMAERLLSIYILHLKRVKKDVNIQQLKMSFVSNTEFNESKPVSPVGEYVYKTFADGIAKSIFEMRNAGLPQYVQAAFALDYSQENQFKGKKLIMYGAGRWANHLLEFLDKIDESYPIMIWDKNAKPGQVLKTIPVVSPNYEDYSNRRDIVCVVTIFNEDINKEVREELKTNEVLNVISRKEYLSYLSKVLWREGINI